MVSWQSGLKSRRGSETLMGAGSAPRPWGHYRARARIEASVRRHIITVRKERGSPLEGDNHSQRILRQNLREEQACDTGQIESRAPY
jgi:hypothetical protein